jgi:protein tyrosine/serine phosphatase
MSVSLTRKHTFFTSLVAALLLAASASAQTQPNGDLSKIRIKNFGQINQSYYRGAQPENRDYPALAALGIKTVIDLTRDGRGDEQSLVEREGMRFYRIPLTTSERPSEAAVAQFLKLVNNPANQPVFIHCQGGRHRTGVMTAVYRITNDGWNADRAYDEMRQYHFEGFPAHPVLKRFVFDYFSGLDQARQARNSQAEKAVGASK